MIRKYKNAFLRFYRIYTEMALPESSASAYSAISANIKFLSGSRARVTLAVDVIFYGLERRKNSDRCAFALLAVSAAGSAHGQTAYSAISANIKLKMKNLKLKMPIKHRLSISRFKFSILYFVL